MWSCVLNSTAVLGSMLGVCSCHSRACCDVVSVRLLGFQGAVWSCMLNSTAMLAATASADFSAKLWDAITGNELHTLQHSHIARVCQFAERSSQLITGGVRLPLSISPDPAQVQSCFPRHGTAQSRAQHSKPRVGSWIFCQMSDHPRLCMQDPISCLLFDSPRNVGPACRL